MNKYSFLENFSNSCITPCLVGDLSPYEFTEALFYAGKNYRLENAISPVTMASFSETFTNNSNNSVNIDIEVEKAKIQLTQFIPDDCFINIFLNSNLRFKLKNDSVDKYYQVDIKLVKVPDSNNYRLVCRPRGFKGESQEYGYFLVVNSDSDNSNSENNLIMSDEALYTISSDINNSDSTTSLNVDAENAATLFNQYNGTGTEVEYFDNQENFLSNNQSDINTLSINSNNTLLFNFWKTYDQKILIHVFDNGNSEKMAVGSYGYMKYKNSSDYSISFISESDLFSSEKGELNDAGANKLLINLNYDLHTPYKIPSNILNTSSKTTNIKFPFENKDPSEGTIKLGEYYINDNELYYIYKCTINGTESHNHSNYGFNITKNNNIVITNYNNCNTCPNVLLTFWQTLDKQFIITKFIETKDKNLNYSSEGTDSDALELMNTNYNLIGIGDNNELIVVDRFSDTVCFTIEELELNVYTVKSIIDLIQTEILVLLRESVENEISKLSDCTLTVSEPEPEPESQSDKCNNDTVNSIICFKFLSMFAALFLFIDLDYSENIIIKIFRGIFVLLFSEIYLLYHFIRMVILKKMD